MTLHEHLGVVKFSELPIGADFRIAPRTVYTFTKVSEDSYTVTGYISRRIAHGDLPVYPIAAPGADGTP